MTENIADSEGRQSGEFTEEESKIHHAGFKVIFEGMQKGLGFDEACAGLEVVDPEMRRIIVDDYLKVTIAEQHFQAQRSLEEVAADLKVPAARVEAAKSEMMREVEKAAVDHYHRTSSGAGGGEEGEPPGGPGGKQKS
jgi:hypothetical protein